MSNEVKMQKYIGVTIGPIVNALSKARKTGELWGASYIFSYTMKSILIKLMKSGIDRESFILPSPYLIEDENGFCESTKEERELATGMGLYPDRIIFRSKDTDYQTLESVINDVLLELGECIASEINEKKEDVFKYLSEYLQIHYLEKEIDNPKNIISDISELLDVLELQNKTIKCEKNDYILNLIANDKIKKSFLFKDAYNSTYNDRFSSIGEIALGEVYDTLKDSIFKEGSNSFELDDEKYFEIERELKKINSEITFKKVSKYIAIVQSDGDNVGRIIKNIKSVEGLQEFSKKLLRYSLNANKKIKDYGGVTIYAGGDDLLFFAPVVYNPYNLNGEKEYKHIFNLIEELNGLFKGYFNEEIIEIENKCKETGEVPHTPALSFGISVSYKKYPLKESLLTSIDNLFCNAKEYKWKCGENVLEKNALSIKIMKHSGQEFSFLSSIKEKNYEEFRKLVGLALSTEILNSVIEKIRNNKALLKEIGKDRVKVKNYIENTFRDEYKQSNKLYFDSLITLINEIYISKGDDEAFDTLSAYIKFISFIKEGGV